MKKRKSTAGKKANGTLKKGFKFLKGGRVVKAKKRK
jgi:hypothetical protein